VSKSTRLLPDCLAPPFLQTRPPRPGLGQDRRLITKGLSSSDPWRSDTTPMPSPSPPKRFPAGPRPGKIISHPSFAFLLFPSQTGHAFFLLGLPSSECNPPSFCLLLTSLFSLPVRPSILRVLPCHPRVIAACYFNPFPPSFRPPSPHTPSTGLAKVFSFDVPFLCCRVV